MGDVHGDKAQFFFHVSSSRGGTAKQTLGHLRRFRRNGHHVHGHGWGKRHVHHRVGDVDGFDAVPHALVGEGRGALGHLEIVEAIDVGHRSRASVGRHDRGAHKRRAIGVVQLAAHLTDGGVVGLGLEPCIGGSDRRRSSGTTLGAVDVPRLKVGFGPVLGRRSGGDGQGDVFPAFARGLVHQRLTFQGHRVVDVFHPNVVTGVQPACCIQ